MKRKVIIIGAGSGLGLSIARRFGKEGFEVILVARREAILQEMCETHPKKI
ncbi:MAG: SDR family NAD(P)-dependent oxidoreductase [Bacteroides sp.]|nr:SDR family NAD(P)-dependent oxidoreductase [Bacteroides sp.]